MGITALAVGLLLAGAEPEELITALIAALRDRGGIAAGDAIGANITMLTLVFGLAALMNPLPIGRRTRGYLMGAAALSAMAAILVAGGLARPEGLTLAVLGVLAVVSVWRWEKAPPAVGDASGGAHSDEDGWKEPSLALAGIGFMAAGGWLAVSGAERLVAAMGVTDSVVGLSLIGLATSAELLALVVAAHRRQITELAVAGVVGSVGYNATITLGVAALARPLSTSGIAPAAWLAAGLPLLVLILSWKRSRIGRWTAPIFLGIYAVYLVLLYT